MSSVDSSTSDLTDIVIVNETTEKAKTSHTDTTAAPHGGVTHGGDNADMAATPNVKATTDPTLAPLDGTQSEWV